MQNTPCTFVLIATFILGLSIEAGAQAPAQPESNIFASISAGGQLQSRDFSQITTFTLFNEEGSVAANQTVGTGFLFDVTVGYPLPQVLNNFAVAVGFSSFNGTGEAASIASIPNPVSFGRPTIKTFTASDYGDLSQTTQSVHFMAVWMMPLSGRFDLTLFGGPSVVRVKQEMASVSTDSPVAAIDSQSKTTGKAGVGGADLSYRLNDRYSVGGFIRYAGGKANLPSVDLTFGGVQAAGGIRFRL
jgi:hypothetical protein